MRLIRDGDRFRLTRSLERAFVGIGRLAPAHSMSCEASLPEGTVVVAVDQVPGATAFAAYPEEYDALEDILVPTEIRSSPDYQAYHLSFKVADVGELLQPLPPLQNPPGNRLPRDRDR